MKINKLLVAAAGAVFSAFCWGLEAAQAHGGHSHSGTSTGSPEPLSPSPSLFNSGSIFYGEPLPIGSANFRSFVRLNDDGNPLDLGVNFSRETLTNLSNLYGTPPTFPAPTRLLYPSLPTQAATTPYRDLELIYYNSGHTPVETPGSRDEHIDFAFYLPSRQDRLSTICPNASPSPFWPYGQCSSNELEAAARIPEPSALPTNFSQVPFGTQFFGQAGAGTSYFQIREPNPEASVFYGFYNGEMTYIDLLISNDFLEEVAAQPNSTFTAPLAQPSGLIYPEDGYYPTNYSVSYDEANGYAVVLGGFTFRPAEPTEPPPPPPSDPSILPPQPDRSENRLTFLGDPDDNQGTVAFFNLDTTALDAAYPNTAQNSNNAPIPYYVTGRQSSPEVPPSDSDRTATLTEISNFPIFGNYVESNGILLEDIGLFLGQRSARDFTQTWNLDDVGPDRISSTGSISERIYEANPEDVELFLSYQETKIIEFGYSPLYTTLDFGPTPSFFDDRDTAYTDPIPVTKVPGLNPLLDGLVEAFLQDLANLGSPNRVQLLADNSPPDRLFTDPEDIFAAGNGFGVVRLPLPADIQPVPATTVPDPSSVLGLLMLGTWGAVSQLRINRRKKEVT